MEEKKVQYVTFCSRNGYEKRRFQAVNSVNAQMVVPHLQC